MDNNEQVLQNSTDCTTDSCKNNNNNNVTMSKPTHGRYCHIVKRPDFDGYGFNLHSEKVKPGQYIGKVDANSPAEAAGLREGDQIIEVNGVNIGSETHKQVVQRIKAIANEVRLLLLDPNEASKMQTQTQTTANSKRSSSSSTASPKSQNKVTAQPNMAPAADAAPSEALVAAPVPMGVPVPAPVVPEHKDYITSISMVSTAKAPAQPSSDTTDHGAGTINGHNIKSNGNAMEANAASVATVTTPEPPADPMQRPNDNGTASASAPAAEKSKTGLNLNLTAAEMRAKLLAKKKYDPKNESVDLKKKFEIIQKL